MIQLKDEDFNNLLSDIYTAFAPQKLNGVPDLVEKYKDSAIDQRNAIQMAFLKYVNATNPNFIKYKDILPEVGTEKNILFLMEAYARGERMISEDVVLEIKKKSEEEESARLAREEKERAEKEAEEQRIKEEKEAERLRLLQSAKETSEKSKESLEQELETARIELKEFQEKTIEDLKLYKQSIAEQQPKQVSAFEDMELEIIGFEEPVSREEDGTTIYQVADINTINIPPKKYIATLSIGQRFMTQDVEGRVVGIEVVNITDDYVSDPEKPIRMINLRKV